MGDLESKSEVTDEETGRRNLLGESNSERRDSFASKWEGGGRSQVQYFKPHGERAAKTQSLASGIPTHIMPELTKSNTKPKQIVDV